MWSGPIAASLTAIVSQDPMYVTFPVSQREFLQLRGATSARRRHGADRAPALLRRHRPMTSSGKINFVDVTVDRATDSVMVRASVPNPQGRLIDGQLVKVIGRRREAGGEGAGPAVGADRRSAGRLCLHRRGRQGRGPPPEARRRESGRMPSSKSGLEGGEQVIVEGLRGAAARARRSSPRRRPRSPGRS